MEARLSASAEPVREPAPTDSSLGLILANRYRLARLIGTGGMSEVYEASDLALDRTVAVKLVTLDARGPSASGDTASGEARRGRLNDEVRVLAHLNHFALVTLYDAGTAVIDGVPRSFLVTEFIDGVDLRGRIQEGPLEPGEVARLGADLCAALAYVHSQGVVHRDIKPANVLLAPSDFPGRGQHAKLADFGIARLVDAAHQTRPGTVIGTAGYLSPEQARGQHVGPASDVYSLGLVLLESLTAEQCYPGTATESALARLHRQPEVPPWLGEGWRHLLTGMTVREAEHRLPAADAATRLLALVPPTNAPDDDTTRAIVSPLVDPREAPEPGTDAPTAVLPAVHLPTMHLPAVQLPEAQPPEAQPAVAPVTQPSPLAETAPSTGARHRNAPRRSRWRLVLGGVLVAVLGVAAALLTVPREDPAPTPPAYPAVEGELGEHLEQLQESVNP